ncbi:MAG: hypothetical protein R3D25_16965 [Geminicoccaceae bacterium]
MRSSTTSSETALEGAALRRFGARLLWLVPLAFLLMMGLNATALRFDVAALPDLANFHQQLRKLAAAGPIDTLFLGDSSLGRMMDMQAWQAATGERALHLALTGGEGFAGDLGMLQRTLLVQRPRRVILVHTPDMPTRGISWSGYLLARPDGAAPLAIPPDRLAEATADLLVNGRLLRAILRSLPYHLFRLDWPFLADGHVRGRARMLGGAGPAVANAVPLTPADIQPESREMLGRIAATCAAEKLDCRFAFGPVWEGVCTGSADYLEAVRNLVVASGLPVVAGTPLCAPATDLDDAIDHILRERRAFYTDALRDRIEGRARAGD